MNELAGPIITTASFCSGVAWLDAGVRTGCEYFGWRTVPALLCEWEGYAASVLLERMEETTLEPAPIWCGDLADFDGRPFRGVVDIATAGLPCQPYSSAGKRLGNIDERSHGADGDGPLPQFLRIVDEMRPALVFLENVPAWVRGGWFRPFGDELSGLGYEIESPLFITAESVGASHRRERVFVLAHRTGGRFGELRQSPGGDGQSHGGGRTVGEPERDGRGQRKPRRGSNRRTAVGGAGAAVGNARGFQRAQGNGRNETEAAKMFSGGRDTPLFAPGPSDLDGWNRVVADGSYDFRAPAIKPGLRVLVDGLTMVVDASRADQLRCAGNGCVPLQAAVAFVELVRRL